MHTVEDMTIKQRKQTEETLKKMASVVDQNRTIAFVGEEDAGDGQQFSNNDAALSDDSHRIVRPDLYLLSFS